MARSADTLTITRAQDGSSARTILVGDQVALADLAKLWQDIERSSPVAMPQAKVWEQAISPSAPTFPVSTQLAVGSVSSFNGFPGFTATKFGALLAVFIHTATENAAPGIVRMLKSTDGGVTWGPSTDLVTTDASHTVGGVGIVSTQTGRLIVAYYTLTSGLSVVDLNTIYSDDGGATWSSPASHTVYSGNTATAGTILQHSSGTLLWPVYGENSGDTADRCGVLISRDDGITWSSVINIAAASSGYTEMTLIELADRSVRAYIRNDSSNLIYQATSSDVGATWTSITSTGIGAHPGLPVAIVVPKSQAIILFYRSITGPDNTVYRYSFDGGANWSSEQTYHASGYRYAGGIAIGDDLVGVAVSYLSGGGADLWFSTIQVTKRPKTLTAGSGVTLTDSIDGTDQTIAAAITESNLTLSNVTTDDVSTTKHGFVPKAPNDTTKFLRGDATWATPSGGAGSAWSVLTNGDGTSPALIFDSGGDVIMTETLR